MNVANKKIKIVINVRSITLHYKVVPKFQVYQIHAGKASKVIASAFLFQQHSSPYGPKQGDIDPSADKHGFL